MDTKKASKAFSALAQESRLRAFRLLMQEGSQGMPAGEIATALGIPHNTLSTHLAILVNANLIGSRRESRSIYYFVTLDGVRELLGFLLEDCCQGKPDLCASLLDSVLPTPRVPANRVFRKS
ncbi:MAG: metalloregulator ArsR/SmtB family transcription factor [Pseudomonadales bacterium]